MMAAYSRKRKALDDPMAMADPAPADGTLAHYQQQQQHQQQDDGCAMATSNSSSNSSNNSSSADLPMAGAAGAGTSSWASPAKRLRWLSYRPSTEDASALSLDQQPLPSSPLARRSLSPMSSSVGASRFPTDLSVAAAAAAARGSSSPSAASTNAAAAALAAASAQAAANNGGASSIVAADASRMGELLHSLDRDQLIKLLVSVMAVHPDAQPTVAALMPRPTLESVSAILAAHEKRLFDSFPYSKFGPDRSDYSFNRVRPHLDELRDAIVQYLDFFTLPASYPGALQHEYAASAFGFLHLATSLVHRLPLWQNEQHNTDTRSALYDRLGRYWRLVVGEVSRRARDEGKVYGSFAVGEWARNLHLHAAETKNAFGFGEAYDDFRRMLGWVIGLDADDASSSPSGMGGRLGFPMVAGHAPGLFNAMSPAY
ncbi:Cut8 six-helix bundle-domain-containing protein [Entophlyctis helioformis]|nr:Cut8 six-helix bundle-domain-containing protein [Entophlyctis helioformis]